MTTIKCFYYNQLIKAVLADEHAQLRNMTMYPNDIIVYKNTSTKIALEVKRLDRKALILSQDKRYFLNVLSLDGEYSKLRKQFEPIDIDKGRLSVTVTAIDIGPIMCGRYYYSITYVDDQSNEYVLYTAQDKVNAAFMVKDYALPVSKPPFIQFNFTRQYTFKDNGDVETVTDEKTFVSSRLPITNPLHTVVFKMEDFYGRIVCQKTRDPDPFEYGSWEDFQTLEFNHDSDDVELELEDLNAMFVRFKFIDKTGNEGKVIELSFI